MKFVYSEDRAAVAEARPSATVVVVREGSRGIEVLLLKRNPELKHMPGAWVFPGGKVDDDDTVHGLAEDDIETRARLAAVRELHEEARLELSVDTLQYFSHWLTPPAMKRRFATWFYLAPLPAEAVVEVDGSEIVDHRWVTPEAVLAEQAEGRLQIPPPTFVTVTDIGTASSLKDLVSMVSDREPPYFFPTLHNVEGGMVFLYPGDAGYESGDITASGPRHRMVMQEGTYCYERDYDWPLRCGVHNGP